VALLEDKLGPVAMLRTFKASNDPCPCFHNVFWQLRVREDVSFLLDFNWEYLPL
jgi:hypothetical protein